MTLKIFIIRHAEADEKLAGMKDIQRELNTNGLRQATFVGQFLKKHKAKTIEAYVIEYKTNVPINKDDDLNDIQNKMDAFLLETQRTVVESPFLVPALKSPSVFSWKTKGQMGGD